jgi:hypothetical protein
VSLEAAGERKHAYCGRSDLFPRTLAAN